MTDQERAIVKEHIGYGICNLSRLARYLDEDDMDGTMAELLALSIRCERIWSLVDDRPKRTVYCFDGDETVH